MCHYYYFGKQIFEFPVLSFPDLIGESSFFNMFWIVRSSRTMTIVKYLLAGVNIHEIYRIGRNAWQMNIHST